ncbi:Decapping nuclease RAI1 [Escovopsis weberi]|uniref:Decapping nuclease n=1 Tax=Escovopsis weberi TaxID=150374 RepID=A0A0M8N2Q4_ESCWE|nr:Decapping nuclease RAI1 [Escovopsis weberi]
MAFRSTPRGFSIQPIGRFVGASQPEFACFSYDDNHEFHLDDSSLRYYYTPQLGADLSRGFDTFEKLDDSVDGHLDALLKTITAHERDTGKKIDADIVTWRGMMTKGCIFIEENHGFKMKSRQNEDPRRQRKGPSLDVMSFWGYKFETLSTLPRPWGETPRAYIEGRESQVVNNKAQYCSVVRTGIGRSILCLGGEVDAVWDAKPTEAGKPINWVELKTSAQIRGQGDADAFHRKLMKYWIQSFLLGVPKIIIGFRTREGILAEIKEIETQSIPQTVNARANATWNADVCVNFTAAFLDWLKQTINDEGVWRISCQPAVSSSIEVFKVEETGHGDILSDDFKNWRIKLALGSETSSSAQ